ncbi:hypothetical protein PO909_007349 [Leuciscus waleckii]
MNKAQLYNLYVSLQSAFPSPKSTPPAKSAKKASNDKAPNSRSQKTPPPSRAGPSFPRASGRSRPSASLSRAPDSAAAARPQSPLRSAELQTAAFSSSAPHVSMPFLSETGCPFSNRSPFTLFSATPMPIPPNATAMEPPPVASNIRAQILTEFAIAFSRYSEIICAALPHRRRELNDYLAIIAELALSYGAQWNQCPYWGALDTELHNRVFLGCRNISCAVCRSVSHSTTACPLINPPNPPRPDSSPAEDPITWPMVIGSFQELHPLKPLPYRTSPTNPHQLIILPTLLTPNPTDHHSCRSHVPHPTSLFYHSNAITVPAGAQISAPLTSQISV